jgi:hypothetical protein
MEMTQTVSNPTEAPHEVVKAGAVDGMVLLATILVELKPERVQESLAAGDAGAATLSLQLAIHQSQTVTFGLSGSGLTITFNNGSSNNGGAAPAA